MTARKKALDFAAVFGIIEAVAQRCSVKKMFLRPKCTT